MGRNNRNRHNKPFNLEANNGAGGLVKVAPPATEAAIEASTPSHQPDQPLRVIDNNVAKESTKPASTPSKPSTTAAGVHVNGNSTEKEATSEPAVKETSTERTEAEPITTPDKPSAAVQKLTLSPQEPAPATTQEIAPSNEPAPSEEVLAAPAASIPPPSGDAQPASVEAQEPATASEKLPAPPLEELLSHSASAESSESTATRSMDSSHSSGSGADEGKPTSGKQRRVRFSTEPPVILGAEGVEKRNGKTHRKKDSDQKRHSFTGEDEGPATHPGGAGVSPVMDGFTVPTFENARCSTPSTGDAAAQRAARKASPQRSPVSTALSFFVMAVRQSLASASPSLRKVVSALVKVLIGVLIGSLLPAKALSLTS